jgi:methionine sulfoxide reductase heme-binding subunit
VIDTYTSIRLQDAVVPFLSSYKRVWVGFGALAFDAMIALGITSGLRQRIGYRLWRAIHWAGYLSWPCAIVHGLGAGTDSSQAWVVGLTVICIVAVLASAAHRVGQLIPARRLAR